MPTTLFQAEPETRTAHGKSYAYIPLAGHLGEHNLSDFSEKIEPLLEEDHAYLVFDLGELDLMSSRTVGYLENLHRKLEAAEKRMAFINANNEIREILEFIGLANLIATFDEEKKFLEAVRNEEI